jgi:hypothetical protein
MKQTHTPMVVNDGGAAKEVDEEMVAADEEMVAAADEEVEVMKQLQSPMSPVDRLW